MSSFNKPHSSPPVIVRRFRDRKYPYIISSRPIVTWSARIECEACLRTAKFTLEYEPNKDSLDVSVVFLCDAHERQARYSKWDEVFKDMNLKIGNGK